MATTHDTTQAQQAKALVYHLRLAEERAELAEQEAERFRALLLELTGCDCAGLGIECGGH